MDSNLVLLLGIILGLVSWLMKIVPFVFVKKKIENKFLSSFLYYIPYAIMTSMTIPEVFHSTSSFGSAAVGVVVAVILSLLDKSLLTVSLSSTAAVFLIEKIFNIV